ncbi:MAG TPA: orotate phosphoribosyltransferase [Nitrospiria bacterium]|jgi:orotate phosphoribosyltransferase|nr:orotate phosphoribosyltransferase [Nitrospiria bacterium]
MPPRKKSEAPSKSSDRDQLRDLLFRESFRCSDRAVFKLTSGQMSRYYVDCKKVTLDPKGAALIGRLVFERIKPLHPQGVGGLTLGADPIAVAVALTSHLEGQPVPAFIIRKEPKGHGSRAWIEGNLPEGAGVVVVEDVVTTGGSTLKAIERLKAHGCKILKVVALVDRQEGGREKIEASGYLLESLFTVDDLLVLAGASRSSSEPTGQPLI